MNKEKIFISICICLLSAILFFHPFKLTNFMFAKNRVEDILTDKILRQEAFGETSDIIQVKYIGYNIYFIETEEGNYTVEITEIEDSKQQNIVVFNEKSHVIQFQ
ncbi:MAG TPA: hypothetical protein VK061_01080 [Bacillota bacterium]|nr:hypothetical protein [Bacillota bacterium]